jgi:membrane protease YdiL (CAAX protease family)
MLVLQVGLGPVLEEILFRGYLIRLALSALKGLKSNMAASMAAVLISAALFGGIHMLQPPTGGKDIAAIAVMGLVYGSIRMRTRSTATAAVAHGVYNAILHIGMFLSGSRLFERS